MLRAALFLCALAIVAARPKPAHTVPKATKDVRSHVLHHRTLEEAGETIEKGKDILLVIDVQKDFHKASDLGNGLGVPGTDDAYTEVVNEWVSTFVNAGAPVIYSLDWHPPNHCSFEHPFPPPSTYKSAAELAKVVSAGLTADALTADRATTLKTIGEKLFDTIKTCGPRVYSSSGVELAEDLRCKDARSLNDYAGSALVRWPPHCVQGQDGANLAKGLYDSHGITKVYKGYQQDHDSYSAWGAVTTIRHNPRDKSDADTLPMLVAHSLGGKDGPKPRRIFVLGLATDYCVRNTVKDFANALKGENPPDGHLAPKFKAALGGLADTQVIFVADGSRGVEFLEDDILKSVTEMKDAGATILPPVEEGVPKALQTLVSTDGTLPRLVGEYFAAVKNNHDGKTWNGVKFVA